MDYPYKNLVFEGGGVKAVAYGGVFEVLEQRQITPQIQSVAETSAGAITPTMMSLNYSAEEFLKIMMTLNFEKFEDGCDLIGPFRLIRHFGWFKGNYFLNLMESYIEKKTGDGQKPGNGAASKNRVTLKAFANSNPGCALATLGKGISFIEDATLKELRRRLFTTNPRNPFQVCAQFPRAFQNPGFQSKPWAGIGERFQRYSFGMSLVKSR